MSTAGEESSKRALALDALRGLAILAMAMSGYIPYGVLPGWMYHRQTPPPTHEFTPGIPGITWVDLVFPFFLFSMGAAIPLALSRRVRPGQPQMRLYVHALTRFALLAAFAIYRQHVGPYTISPSPSARVWLVGLAAFFLTLPMFGRFPPAWKPWQAVLLRGLGWGGAAVLLSLIRFPDGSGFSVERSGIIILVLANVSLTGTIVWLLTRQSILGRLGVMAVVLAMKISAGAGHSWLSTVWNSSPVPWLFQMDFQKYLLVIIPGTIAGDLLLKWFQSGSDLQDGRVQSSRRLNPGLAAALAMALPPLVLAGLYGRWVGQTVIGCLVLGAAGLAILRRPAGPDEDLAAHLFRWGCFWLVLGLCFEPFEGGIRKDSATISYHLVTSGLALFLLMALAVIIDFGGRGRWWTLLIANGQNPLLAYIAMTNLVPPLWALSGIGAWVAQRTQAPWPGVFRGFLETLLLAVLVSLFTRWRIYLRT